MSYLDTKALVLVSAKLQQDVFTVASRSLGYRDFDVETSLTNIFLRLKDTSYKICFIFESLVGKEGMTHLLDRMKINIHSKHVPVIVICDNKDEDSELKYYEAGAQRVLNNFSSNMLKDTLLIFTAWLNFIEQYKEGKERQFRR